MLEAFEADPLEIEGAHARRKGQARGGQGDGRRARQGRGRRTRGKDPVERALAAAEASAQHVPEAQRPQFAQALEKLRALAAKGKAMPPPAAPGPGKLAETVQALMARAKTLAAEGPRARD